ncbi:hypothetical protein [Pseudophaeobacter sp.]|uniref:hypothetical protein n=1 Tax=Pseudophaeobacter sp. TaxID=1971739 RepID=UPI0032971BFB
MSSRAKNTERSFQERKEAYVGLLEAYHQAAIAHTGNQEAAAKNFAYWQLRCEIVGPRAVRDAIKEIVLTNDDRKKRSLAHEELKSSTRRDLTIASN